MVFSFFKKQPEKMITRPAVAPRQVEGRESASSGGKESSDTQKVKAEESGAPKEESVASAPVSDFSDFAFSDALPSFQVEAEVDPVDAEAEEAAVLFANCQDQAAQAVLESAVKKHRSGPAERLWMMLFDLYRLSGQQPAFEALGIEYARAFEKSPPAWRGKAKSKAVAEAAAGSVLFKGDLLGSNTQAFSAVQQSLEKNPRLRLDMSKVKECDPEGCGCLLDLLVRARKSKRQIELRGREALGELVQGKLETGVAEGKECWLLLLELCQLQGRQDAFEEVAIDYAVTFEESPPSWEAGRVAAPEPVAEIQAQAADDTSGGDSYVLQGEVKSFRFGDLAAHAEKRPVVLIDCEDLARMDFISAGALLNVLTTIRRSGKQIVFRHPNRLVAELLGVVGLKSVASVVFAKQ